LPGGLVPGPCSVQRLQQKRARVWRSAAYKAQRAAEQAEPDQWVRSASMAADGTVRVTTHAGTIVHVAKDRYNGSVRGFGR
jgi:hypothetical protein